MKIDVQIVVDGVVAKTLAFSEETLLDLIWKIRNDAGELGAVDGPLRAITLEDILRIPEERWLSAGMSYREQRAAWQKQVRFEQFEAGTPEAAQGIIARALSMEAAEGAKGE